MRSTPFRTLAFTTSYSAFGLIAASMLAACGPSRLSDGDVDRLCMLQVRCSSGFLTQEACVASVEAQRDTMNMQGCGGQFGAVARCAIRADECTSGVPEDCVDEQMRLTTCMNRRDSGPAMPGTDAAIVVPDANVGCPSTSEEFGSSYCLDGCDNDGDLTIDCNDETCCGSIECPSGTVCGGGSCEPASFEEGSYCFDGCDNDGDAVFDCNDSGCCASLEGSCGSGTVCGTPSCEPASFEEETYCEDGCDNDGDGDFDCNDSGCCAWLSGTCATGTLCGGASADISLRTSSGWLEVLYMGEWRSICDDSFSMEGANVACRQMGFSGASTWGTTTGSESFWLDDVVCTGSESSLADCSHGDWGYDNCSASECISLVCF
ncbi:MAG: scavenger receptor cysteine-rich domain-containing protein [Deltaproteobacteria bacterium]|nr:scavenger receptor cysteine-rich domain-containing protein [Deltaproteobacteria bacterium]